MKTDAEFKVQVETCPELVLYLLIEMIGGAIWRMGRELRKGHIPEESIKGVNRDLDEMHGRIRVAVDQTSRFGVEQPRIYRVKGEVALSGSDDYWLWYRWWDAWQKSLTDDQYRSMDADMIADRDLSKWRPDGDWKAVPEGFPSIP